MNLRPDKVIGWGDEYRYSEGQINHFKQYEALRVAKKIRDEGWNIPIIFYSSNCNTVPWDELKTINVNENIRHEIGFTSEHFLKAVEVELRSYIKS